MLAILGLVIIVLVVLIVLAFSLGFGILVGNAFYDKNSNSNSRNSGFSSVSSRNSSRR